MENKNTDYSIKVQKVLAYSYIFRLERFFKKYNEEHFGAHLINFDIDNRKIMNKKVYSYEKEDELNKLFVKMAVYNGENPYVIPFVTFNFTCTSSIEKCKIITKYNRYVTINRSDIFRANQSNLKIAHEKFTDFEKRFYTMNFKTYPLPNSVCNGPDYRNHLSYAYIRRLKELEFIISINKVMKKEVYDKILAHNMPNIMGLEVKRSILSRIDNGKKMSIDDIRANMNMFENIEGFIHYMEILESDEKTLLEAHHQLDVFLRGYGLNENHVDETRFSHKSY